MLDPRFFVPHGVSSLPIADNGIFKGCLVIPVTGGPIPEPTVCSALRWWQVGCDPVSSEL